jgi:hypothetical protein
MPDSFSEDIIDGTLIDISEREGKINILKSIQKAVQTVKQSVVNVFKPQSPINVNIFDKQLQSIHSAFIAADAERARKAAEEQAKQNEKNRLAAIEAERIRDEALKATLGNTYNQLMIQYQQSIAKKKDLQIKIIEQRQLIPPINVEITKLTNENTRLKNKDKSLTDNTLFLKNLVSGTDTKDGYTKKIVENQKELDSIILQEIDIDSKIEEDIGEITEGFSINTNNATPLTSANIVYKSSIIKYQIIELGTYINIATNNVDIEKKRINRLEIVLTNVKTLIEKKRAHISRLTRENKELKLKNNTTLDHLQYNRSLVFGNDEVDGYKDSEINQHIIKTQLENQPIGTPIDIDFANKTEGFINGATGAYNEVATQNRVLENQISTVKNNHSIDSQLTANLIQRKKTVQFINKILIFIFIIAFGYSCFRIYQFPNMNKYVKLAIILIMFLTIFILHSIEYILLHVVPYFSALILGTPYNSKTYWNKPGIYDYLPTSE